ncbi:MAG: heme-binding protein [Acidobacteria bacterium]|nr:heme-binding protein [Acidobacteriota bacterium]MBI3424548.1 heme-binding protein [Acidobacteriota bacterium]
MKAYLKNVMLLALLLSLGNIALAQVIEKKTLTLDGAKKVIDAAKAEARRVKAPGGVIAVVDDGGNLMALERLDGTFAAGAQISIGKARTSALFKKPTKVFEDIIKNGRTAMVALPDSLFTPLQGGVPVVVDGQIVGAVGVSGAASAQQDEELAIAGASALANPEAGKARVSYFEKEKVTAAFAKGAVLFDQSDKYMVHASHRDKAGMVEVHEQDADIIYVLEGTATFVTGGQLVDGKTIAPGELRGTDVKGGETRTISKGDVIIVPAGTPHWFKEVPGPLNYYVVKAR